LQGLELIGVDYAIRYLDSSFSGPASVIQGWLDAAVARARGQVARLRVVLAPTARRVRNAAVACGSWVGRKVSAVLAWVKNAALWLLRHRLLVAGSMMESLALTSLYPFASTNPRQVDEVAAHASSLARWMGAAFCRRWASAPENPRARIPPLAAFPSLCPQCRLRQGLFSAPAQATAAAKKQ
jgi:hypothetical protein